MNYTTFISSITQKYGSSPMFLKVLKENQEHYGLTYKLGINEDSLTFNPTGSCESGGLYFSINEYITKFCDLGTKIAIIKLMDDALFYIEPNDDKFKTNKFIIEKIYTFQEFYTEYQKIAIIGIKYNNEILQYVKEQTEELCKLAVQQNGDVLKYVKVQTDELCKLAVQKNGLALQYVNKQTNELCKLAVQQNGHALEYVKEQTDELCKLAVQQNGFALQFVKEQTEELCKLAVQQNGLALYYVKKQTDELCKLAVQHDGFALRM